jgi:hypothetical protein
MPWAMGFINPTPPLSRSRASLIVVLGVGLALLSGCGAASTSKSTLSRVQVSLTAPTSGARVAVATIEVLGNITPENAVLHVSGKRVRVRHGVFKTPILLHEGLTRIRIEARAKGFVGSSVVVSVRYAPPRAGTVAAAGGEPGASHAQPASQSARASGPSGGGFTRGVGSLGGTLRGAIKGRAHGCGGSSCGLIP